MLDNDNDNDTEPTSSLSVPSLVENNIMDEDSLSRQEDSTALMTRPALTSEEQEVHQELQSEEEEETSLANSDLQEARQEGEEEPSLAASNTTLAESVSMMETVGDTDPLAVSTTGTTIAETTVDTSVLPWSHVLASPKLAMFSPALPTEAAKQYPAATASATSASATSAVATSAVSAAASTSPFDSSSSSNGKCSFHGTGLQLAVSRSKQTTRCSRRCAALLLDVTILWEQYAQAIFKAGQSLQPMTSTTTTTQTQMQLPTLSVQESTLSWSREWIKLARTVRETVTKQWQACTGTHTDAVTIIWAAYSASRLASEKSRQRALGARNKYDKAVDDAEAAVREWKDKEQQQLQSSQSSTQMLPDCPTAIADHENSTTSLPSLAEDASIDADDVNNKDEQQQQQSDVLAPPLRVTKKLKQVQHYLAKYQHLVASENSAVQQCQRLEGMALESMQNLEEDRVLIFVNALRKTLSAEREALNEMVISLKDDADERSSETLVSEKKGQKTSLSTLWKATSSNFDIGSSGIMDAETLGLPEEIGKLRDQVRLQIAARSTRIQVVRGLATFLENVATVSAKLGTSLNQLIEKDQVKSTGGSSEPLEATLQACEGPRVLNLWNAVTKTIEQEAEAALSLASVLRSVRTKRLDNVLLYGEKSMKVAAESDESAWKQLCEAARAQSKAENRYRQHTAQSAKARDRVRSVDSDNNDKGQSGQPPASPKKVNKHLANMFSIMPEVGGHAMKMLNPGARASIAQRNLEEAGQKESKGRQLLDTTVEATVRTLDAYKSSAEALSSKCEEEDKAGWDDVKFALESFVTQVESSRESRAKSLEEMKAMLDADALAGTVTDINEWAIKTQGIIASKVSLSQEADANTAGITGDIDSGFMLEVNTKLSETLCELLRGVEAEREGTALDAGENADETETENVERTPISPSSSADGEDCSMVKSPSEAQPAVASTEERQTPKWIRRSLTAPNPPGKGEKGGQVRPKLSLGRKIAGREGNGESSQADDETQIFLNYFWPDKVDPQSVPSVVESFSCSFRDSSQRLPSQYGRVFVTSARLIFVSWSQKRLVLKWAEVVAVETAKNFVITGDNHLMLTYTKGSDESIVLLGGFTDRQQTYDLVGKLREEAKTMDEEEAKAMKEEREAKAMKEEEEANAMKDEDAAVVKKVAAGEAKEALVGEPGAKVPPDSTLQKMDIIFSKHLRNISIQRYYEIAWSEGNGTNEKPLYGPWLKKAGHDVEVGDWEFSEVVGAWCKERYPQKRIVTFKVKRRTHLYIGPPIASVIQTQYIRLEGNDKCVFAMTVEFEGIPYCDTFAVEVRWVASREGLNDILIEVGVFVDFRKHSFLKKPIRSGTVEETTPIHKNLFEVVKAACIAAGGVQDVEEEEEEEEAKAKAIEPEAGTALRLDRYTIGAVGAIVLFMFVWRFLLSSGTSRSAEILSVAPGDIEYLGERIDQLEVQLKTVQSTLDDILAALKDTRA